ncbi:MAG: CPBP family intramembrane metalloprotease [Gemmatimonadota bacterium]|nr:MAG: CPBP family intramembrane metalloprotease [Gemmatimonadota bacterium]
MNKKLLNTLFFSKSGLRLIWPIIAVALLIYVGEVLFVDPFGNLLSKVGLSEVTGAVAQNWFDSLGDSLKRILRSIIVVTSILIVLRFLLKKTYAFIGIDFQKNRIVELLLGIALGFLVQFISITLMKSFGWFEVIGFSWNYHSIAFFAPAILFTFVFCVETGIIEEVMFRGFLFNIFENRYSKTIAVIVSSVLFGIVHFSGFKGEFAWWMSIMSSLAAGFVFAQAFLLFRSLWLPFGLHAGWHFAMRLLGSVGLSSDEAVFLVTKVEGPALLVSTKAGGAGLFELIGIMIVSLIMFLMRKNLMKGSRRIAI